jgi:hypothetical protein
MAEDLAAANVNRSYSLAATSIAIFTFMLFFMHPKFIRNEVDPRLFQGALVVMGIATFAFVFASFFYYSASVGGTGRAEVPAGLGLRGDRFWLLGSTMLFLDPSLILFAIGLEGVGSVWFTLWLAYLALVVRWFPRVRKVWREAGR